MPGDVWLLRSDFSRGAEKALATTFAVSGDKLSLREKSLFREANPLGFILFGRNVVSPDQLYRLVNDLKESVGRDCPVLVDQEGGRVQRLRSPHWRTYPAMRSYGDQYALSAEEALENLRFDTLRLAEELYELGINVNCSPVLDVFFEEAHDVIGDRSFSCEPEIVSRLGLSVSRHLLASGIIPVIKHLPGHGRAGVDSHMALPCVDVDPQLLRSVDFVPFKDIARSDVGSFIWGMTAHIVYPAFDEDFPATLSEKIIKNIIRGEIGYNGFLIGDDLDMKALACYGGHAERAKACLKAGCDLVLYCAGAFDVMESLAHDVPVLTSQALERLRISCSFGKAVV